MRKLKHNIKRNVSLKEYTTFKIGGVASFFVEVDDLQRLSGVLNWANTHQQKIFILGGGSNLLLTDKKFDGLIIKIINKDFRVVVDGERVVVNCGAGVRLGKVVSEVVKLNASGLEWAVGIPGTVGGAVRGNAGAFGGEMKDVVKKVAAVNIRKKELPDNCYSFPIIFPNELPEEISQNCEEVIQVFGNKDCEFGYRDSIFKEILSLLIWEVEFELRITGQDVKKNVEEILKRRKSKQSKTIKYPSAGSVFKNPLVSERIQEMFKEDTGVVARNGRVPAGWLVEKVGLKGKRIGGAMVSEYHSNFIVNLGDATFDDVLILIGLIKTAVRNEFGVKLEEEITIIY